SRSTLSLTESDALSLHDALPISFRVTNSDLPRRGRHANARGVRWLASPPACMGGRRDSRERPAPNNERTDMHPHTWHPTEQEHRSEEHTSELQSRENLVCRLLLE